MDMLHTILLYAGLACVAAIVVLSIESHIYVKRYSTAEGIERAVLYRMALRTVCALAALALLVLSRVIIA